MRARITFVVCLMCAALVGCTPGSGIAEDSTTAKESPTAEESVEAFYRPPQPLPAGNDGDVIRSEPTELVLPGPLGRVDATRILYYSRDAHNTQVAVSGLYIPAKLPWLRGGRAPLIAYAPGSHGLAGACAPSKTLTGTGPPDYQEVESASIAALLVTGASIVVTDLQGLGTPGPHTYMIRAAQGHAVLDAARAGLSLGKPSAPVGLFGYSQGGAATAAAAELASIYAPEVPIKGVFTGATPANMPVLMEAAEGSTFAVMSLAGLSGIRAGYPDLAETITSQLNPVGVKLMNIHSDECAPESSATSSTVWTNDGTEIYEVVDRVPALADAFDAQILGRTAPKMPVLVGISKGDDSVPVEQAKAMAESWCALGATVEYKPASVPKILPGTGIGHVVGAVFTEPAAALWLTDRLAGKETSGNCGTF